MRSSSSHENLVAGLKICHFRNETYLILTNRNQNMDKLNQIKFIAVQTSHIQL